MTQPPNEPQSSVMRFGDLKKLIADTVKGITDAGQSAADALTGGANPPSAPRTSLRDQIGNRGGSRSVDQEVKDALAKIAEDKKREEREAALDSKLSELDERTKEKPPREYRRVHKFMGWGE